MQMYKPKQNEQNYKHLWQLLTDLPIGLVLMVFFFLFWIPLIVVFVLSAFADKISQTGLIGDTIGGLTAPVIGLLNAVLVYYAFREQITANERQFHANQEQLLEIRKSNEQQAKAHSEELEEMRMANQVQIQAEQSQRKSIEVANTRKILSELDKIVSEQREKTQFQFSAMGTNIDYGSEGIIWYLKELEISVTLPYEHKDFFSRLSTFQMQIYFNRLNNYMIYIELVNFWCSQLDESLLDESEKQSMMLIKNHSTPFYEMKLSSNQYFVQIVPKKLQQQIQNFESNILNLHNKYSLNHSVLKVQRFNWD